MDLLLVDAQDSFTHNLAQAFAVLGTRVQVVAADTVDADWIVDAAPDLVVFGPGPGHPEDGGRLVGTIRALVGIVPLLGVCLGHQALAIAMGGAVVRHKPMHGKPSAVHHEAIDLFEGVPSGAPMGRYHSLGVDPDRVPSCLRVTAWTDDGVIMGLSHRLVPAWGVQFHPESVMSGNAGLRVLENFVHCGERYSGERYSGDRHSVGKHSVDKHSVDKHGVDKHGVDKHSVDRRSDGRIGLLTA